MPLFKMKPKKHAQSISFYLAATTHYRQPRRYREGERLKLRRENGNKFDPNAIAVYRGWHQVGYVPKDDCTKVRHLMGKHHRLKCFVMIADKGYPPLIQIAEA